LGSVYTAAVGLSNGGCLLLAVCPAPHPLPCLWITPVDNCKQNPVGLLGSGRYLSGNPQLLTMPLQLQPLDILPLIVHLVAALTSYQPVTSD
jgi:hypothetical protein